MNRSTCVQRWHCCNCRRRMHIGRVCGTTENRVAYRTTLTPLLVLAVGGIRPGVCWLTHAPVCIHRYMDPLCMLVPPHAVNCTTCGGSATNSVDTVVQGLHCRCCVCTWNIGTGHGSILGTPTLVGAHTTAGIVRNHHRTILGTCSTVPCTVVEAVCTVSTIFLDTPTLSAIYCGWFYAVFLPSRCHRRRNLPPPPTAPAVPAPTVVDFL
uniref:Uncharacterized protein n=1 Tax=Lygus hesperus TaxID=30085 RepID=A0A146LAN1_LYGHE